MTSLLKVEGLARSFGGVGAMSCTRLAFDGAARAPRDENGARKSISFSIPAGAYRRDAEANWRSGQGAELGDPAEAPASAAAVIEQEMIPIPETAVAGSFTLDRDQPRRFGFDDLGFAMCATRRARRRRRRPRGAEARRKAFERFEIRVDRDIHSVPSLSGDKRWSRVLEDGF